MAKPSPSALIEVSCPCCEATLRIDPATRAVITHKAKEKPPPVEDLAAAVRQLKEVEAQRGDKFQKHVEDERNRHAVLNKKFDELFKQAKEDPDSLPAPRKGMEWD